jgi:hypothetical protein
MFTILSTRLRIHSGDKMLDLTQYGLPSDPAPIQPGEGFSTAPVPKTWAQTALDAIQNFYGVLDSRTYATGDNPAAFALTIPKKIIAAPGQIAEYAGLKGAEFAVWAMAALIAVALILFGLFNLAKVT